MPILIACPCGKQLKVKDEFSGKKVKCPGCAQVHLVPQAEVYGLAPSPVPEAPPPKPRRKKPDPEHRGETIGGWGGSEEPLPPPRDDTRGADEARTKQAGGWGGADEAAPDDDHAEPGGGWGGPDETAPGESRDEQAGGGGPEPATPRPPRRRRRKSTRPAINNSSPREYLYWALALALFPLAISLLGTSEEMSLEDRIASAIIRLDEASEEERDRVMAVIIREHTNEELIDALPGGKLAGAHLARRTWLHWGYALFSAALFMGLALSIFASGHAVAHQLLLVGLFTATIGVFLLLAFQVAAVFTSHFMPTGLSIVTVILFIIKLIGLSYRAAFDPHNGFWLSFLGFTGGVGLCEEVCKALPLMHHFRRRPILTWRACCLWGLASGVGFGIAEGISYSSDFYNGYASSGIYVVRFVSCVALHGIFSAAVGISFFDHQDWFKGQPSWGEYATSLLRVVWVPMVLHGLYDTLLKKEMPAGALVVAIGSFAWLVWKIERTRKAEELLGEA